MVWWLLVVVTVSINRVDAGNRELDNRGLDSLCIAALALTMRMNPVTEDALIRPA